MIIIQLIGGLGNQMFQYACGRHLALLNNTELKLDLSFLENRVPFRKNFVFRNYDLDLFDIKASIANTDDIPLYPTHWKINSIPHRLYNLYKIKMCGYKYILDRKLNSYNQILFNEKILKKRGNIYLAGYWASPRYFEHIKEIIRNDFTFLRQMPLIFNDLIEKIISTNSVCINVRRKEFLLVNAMGFHGIDYINRAVDYITQRVSNPIFYIFSDDLNWCKENIKLDFPTKFVGEEYYGEKYGDYMQLMTMCNHFIISNSSYAWWAAWLSGGKDKIVVTPNKLFQGYNDSDFIPAEWVRV